MQTTAADKDSAEHRHKKDNIMMTKLIIAAVMLIILCFNLSASAELEPSVKKYLLEAPAFSEGMLEGENINYRGKILSFYEDNEYKLIWFGDNMIDNNAYNLISEIKRSREEGLNPEDYHVASLTALLDKYNSAEPEKFEDLHLLDILLTDAYFTLASDYLSGKVDPETLEFETHFFIEKNNMDFMSYLNMALKNENIEGSLQALLPGFDKYKNLKQKLAEFRRKKGASEWSYIPPGEMLAVGASGRRVELLRQNLLAHGYKIGGSASPDYFDENLAEAVRKFQADYGLKADGIVGNNTLRELNISLDGRINQIAVNLERLRWLPDSLGESYIYVNIADYSLDVVEDRKKVMDMKVIVGNEQRSTPVFSDRIRYVVLNPYWTVPKSIAVEDKLPLIKKDISYLKENNYRLYKYQGSSLVELDAAEVEWENIDEDNFHFLIRQDPGDNNALGRVKFLFPNKFSVYLHDTPSRGLFDHSERSFSSGCIRIEKPIEMAKFLLKNNPDWTDEKIDKELQKDREKYITLNTPFTIHLQYATAWVDGEGNLNFRKDIYGRDAKLGESFFKRKREI
ncbi:MAG: L,D-transpeptidase family protein [Bacillota bacterium]